MKSDRLKHSLHNLPSFRRRPESSTPRPFWTPGQARHNETCIGYCIPVPYELAWKTFQKLAQEEGLHVATPRQAFSSALQAGCILPEDEATWLGMIQDRNLTSHTYHENLATEIVVRVRASYFPLIKATVARIES